MSACVLPIAPEFQDPPASQNYPPYFVSTEPEIGSVVNTPMFRVSVLDPNLGDTLHFRWLADYPLFTGNTRVLIRDLESPPPTNGSLQFRESFVQPDCNLNTLAKLPSHRIMVIVSDREFLNPMKEGSTEVDFGRIPSDGHKLVASWTLDMECK